MGVGKGTTARAFSKKYNVYNIDTDDLIESKENRKVKKIFAQDGEEYFRSLEQKTANWIEENVKNTLISCGGGFYKIDNLSKLGTVVLLDASFEWIYNGLLNASNSKNKLKKRPLFSQLDKAEELYNERKEIYHNLADIIINVENKTLDEVLKELSKQI